MKNWFVHLRKITLLLVLLTAFALDASAQTLNDNGSTHTINANGSGQDQGSAQDYTIPSNSTRNSIRFTLTGGDGGKAQAGTCQRFGGTGATTEAVFMVGLGTNELKPGGTIRFVIGKHGVDGVVGGTAGVAGGGGGGTAVLYRPTNNDPWEILAVAGGGGGAYQGNIAGNCVDSQRGQGGQSTEYGGDGGSSSGSGGTSGNGGSSGGGGGTYSDGSGEVTSWGGKKGYSGGGNGGQSTSDGGFGFGGGGAGSGGGGHGGGGGGGYSGGGGGGGVDNGGGGGSYANPSYAYTSSKSAGSDGLSNSQNGHADYAFESTTITWTGAVSHDWHLNGNWSPARVPTSVDFVEIGASANAPYIWQFSPAYANSVKVLSGGDLTLQPNATLNLSPYNGFSGIFNFGLITNNNGTINIATTGTSTVDGILNSGSTFNNMSGGVINIEGMDRYGIANIANSTFTNQSGGTINIGTTSNQIGDDGIRNDAGCEFTNSGTLYVRNTFDIGISNEGNFTNNGNIFVEQTGSWGIIHLTEVFTNNGTITIDLLTNPSRDGLQNRADFNNFSGGTIIIDQVGRHGIYNYNGPFTNEGSIRIGENGSVGNRAIYNADGPSPVFLNNGCGASIHIFSEEIIDLANSFTNSGVIVQESAGSSNIETNNGVILYSAGSFTADNGNTPVSVSGGFSGKKIWTGCDGIAWEAPFNWTPSGTPTASDDVVIYPVGDDPHINSTALAKSVNVKNGGHLFNDGSLATGGDLIIDLGATVEGNGQYGLSGNFMVNGGTFIPDHSTVTMTGTINYRGIGFDPITFYDLVIDKPSDKEVQILADVTVTNNLYINSGDLAIYGVLNGAITCPQLILTAGSDLLNAGSLTVTDADFIIESGATAAGNGLYNIGGNFVVDGGTFTPGTSTVTFNGMPTQRIFPDPVSFYKLTIDKTSEYVYLDADISVSNELKMLSGNLDLNGADIQLTDNGTIIGEGADSYIYSTSGGVVKKTVNLNAPTGVNPGNIGASITSSANLGSTTIQRGHVAQNVNGEMSILRYYDISPTNNSGLDATVRFSYLDHELNGIVEADMTPFRFNGSDWSYYAASAKNATANWVETENVNAFSKWTLAIGCNLLTYYADSDGDGYGDPSVSGSFCEVPGGYVADNTDCNDTDANVNPNPDCSTTTRTWTGHISNDWDEACNWSPNCVPTANDNVVIPDVTNDPVISATTAAVAQSVNVGRDGSLTIESGGSLSIDNAVNNGIDLSDDDATLTNYGTINIGATAIGGNGIYFGPERCRLTNNGGTINIMNATNYGIQMDYNARLENSNNGVIVIDNTAQGAIRVGEACNLINQSNGQVLIGQYDGNIQGAGISLNSGSMTNDNAIVRIDNTSQQGISANTFGINARFVNQNGGQVYIGEIGNIGGEAIRINTGEEFSANLTNGTCSLIKISKPITYSNSSYPKISNSGTIIESATGNSRIQTNNGIINNLNGGNFTVNNNEIIVAATTTTDCSSVSPAFGLGATVDFNFLGIFTDAAATQSAGTYDVTTNTFTPTEPFTLSNYTFYVKIEDPAGGCNNVVEWPVVNNGNLVTCYLDSDGDSYGDPAVSQLFCETCGTGYVVDNTDCNDADGDEFPGQTWYEDADSDGYTTGTTQTACERPAGYRLATELINTTEIDCNDDNALVNPGATEVCNGIDDNCDNQIDEGVQSTFYADTDGDGFGDPANSTLACTAPTGYVTDNTDCDDTDGNEYPDQVWYIDLDNDGYQGGAALFDCERPTGYKLAGELINTTTIDCNDNNPEVYAYQTWYPDLDDDGYAGEFFVASCNRPTGYKLAGELINTTEIDCNDNNALVNPGTTEVCNGIDDNCDNQIDEGVQSTFYADTDGDGFGDPANSTLACTVPTGYVADNTDCDDTDGNEFPGQFWYIDLDNDGYQGGVALFDCERPTGYKLAGELINTTTIDCNDNDPEVYTSQIWSPDLDDDGYAGEFSVVSCNRPTGYKLASELVSTTEIDCNDNNALVNPAASEVCNGIDDNCDNQIDEGVQTTFYADTDGDGFGDPANTILACTAPAGYVANNTDCDDTDGNEFPGQFWYIDLDNDGYQGGVALFDCERPTGYKLAGELINTTTIDCNDNDPEVYTSQIWSPDLDDDGYAGEFSVVSCNRPTGYKLASELVSTTEIDCNDNNAMVNPAASETCNGIDDNCDGQTDEGVQSTFYADSDGDGYGDPAVFVMACSAPDGYLADNTDCDDSDAAEFPGQTWYVDGDNDGYSGMATLIACERPDGYKTADELINTTDIDCNDNDNEMYPGAEEICDNKDNDCNDAIDDVTNSELANWHTADIGGSNGSASYPPCFQESDDVFTINASGFSTSSSDKLYAVYQELCGNGEIVARVQNVSGGGWAGIMLRESLSPGSRKVALKMQGNNNIRREIRMTTNGAVNSLNYFRPQHTWLRLVRNGNNFIGYTAIDGINWSYAFSATINMNGCIYAGLFSESINTNVITTATFDNVTFTKPDQTLSVAGVLPVSSNNGLHPAWDVDVFPNPTEGRLSLRFEEFSGQQVNIYVYNALGEQVFSKRTATMTEATENIDLSTLADGVYTVRVDVGQNTVTKRIVLTKTSGLRP